MVDSPTVEIEPFPLINCSILKQRRNRDDLKSSESPDFCKGCDLRLNALENTSDSYCECGHEASEVLAESTEQKLRHRYDCRFFKRVTYTDWDRSKRHVLVSIPKAPRRHKSANEPQLSLEELLLQQTTAANHRSAMQELAKMQAAMALRESEHQDKKYLRYSRELEKRAMQLCPLEDILVERITHVSRRNNLLWDVNNSNNNHLGHADDSHARRSSQESRQRNVSQGLPMNHGGSTISGSDNSSLRVSLSRLGAAGFGGGGGRTSSLATHRSESKVGGGIFGGGAGVGGGHTTRQMVIEKRIRVPTPLTIEPVTFNFDFQ